MNCADPPLDGADVVLPDELDPLLAAGWSELAPDPV
jgi:hypothetical protein